MNSDVAMLIVLYTVLFLFNLPIDATVSIKDGNIFAGDFISMIIQLLSSYCIIPHTIGNFAWSSLSIPPLARALVHAG
jgi:hypothetical protein